MQLLLKKIVLGFPKIGQLHFTETVQLLQVGSTEQQPVGRKAKTSFQNRITVITKTNAFVFFLQ